MEPLTAIREEMIYMRNQEKLSERLARWILAKFLYLWLFLVLLIAALVGLAFVNLQLSDAIQALFLVVQTMLTFVLVLVTWFYARETAKISRSSEAAAKAAETQTQEVRLQRISASQPVVWPMIWGWQSHELTVILENIGNGPALDIDIYIGRGVDPIIGDCEHKWYSYMTAGEQKDHTFLRQPRKLTATGELPLELSVLSSLVGKYTLFVEWRDLYMSGPFFQARLPFNLEMDPAGNLSTREEGVNIDRIPAKRKPIT